MVSVDVKRHVYLIFFVTPFSPIHPSLYVDFLVVKSAFVRQERLVTQRTQLRIYIYIYMCVCVCVCVKEREREIIIN